MALRSCGRGSENQILQEAQIRIAFQHGTTHVETADTPFDFEKDESFTLSTWFKTDVSGIPDVLIGKLNNNVGYQMYLNSNDEVKVTIASGKDNKILVETIGANVRDDNWHHVAMTYDGSEVASGVKIYLDGVEFPLNVIKDQGFGGMTIQNSEVLTIGNQRSTGNFFYEGMLDDLRIYDYELSTSQVVDLINLL